MAQTTDESCPCCSEDYKSFDFWIGEWEVFDVKGNLVGTNTITKQYDNCVLQEKWISQGPSRGTSYNFFDRSDKTWNQVWIDNTGYVLYLKGQLQDGLMVLKSEITEGKNGPFYNQISWKKNDDKSVTQLWETYNKNGVKLNEAFRGIYKKKLN